MHEQKCRVLNGALAFQTFRTWPIISYPASRSPSILSGRSRGLRTDVMN